MKIDVTVGHQQLGWFETDRGYVGVVRRKREIHSLQKAVRRLESSIHSLERRIPGADPDQQRELRKQLDQAKRERSRAMLTIWKLQGELLDTGWNAEGGMSGRPDENPGGAGEGP